MESVDKQSDTVCSICHQQFTTVPHKKLHERRKHACSMHVVPDTRGNITKFTDTSWRKYLSCVHRWSYLNTRGREAEVAVEGITRFGLELVYTYEVLLAKQPIDDGTVGYHSKCYAKFTNIVYIANAEKRTAKLVLKLGEQGDQDQPVPSVASSNLVDYGSTTILGLPWQEAHFSTSVKLGEQDQEHSVSSVASNSVDCTNTTILGLPWKENANFSTSVKLETESDENADETSADFEDEPVTELYQSSIAKEISKSHHLPNCCLLCRNKVKWRRENVSGKRIAEKLTQCKTLMAGRLVEAAEIKKDETLLVHIRGQNLEALKTKYHHSCYLNYTRFLSRVVHEKEPTINVTELGYVNFCKSIIEERIIAKQEVMRLKELNELFKKCILEKTNVDISSYQSQNLKRKLLISYPHLKFHKPPSGYHSDLVFVGDMSTEEALLKSPSPSICKLCDVCSEKFEFKIELTKHIKIKHSKPFKCSHCIKCFLSELKLKKHLCLFHGGEKISCDICEYKSISYSRLKYHIANIHTSKDKFTFACTKCDYRTWGKVKLKRHEKIHTEDRLFICEKCGKQFRSITSLNFHVLTHSNEKPFKCSLCDKSYKRKDSLQHHKLGHTTTAKKYACGDCDYASIFRSNLMEHIKNVHINDQHYECLVCGKKFKTKNTLRKHQKSVRCLIIK